MEPHKNPYPQPWEKKLNRFQKTVMLRCIRYDKAVPAIQDEVEGNSMCLYKLLKNLHTSPLYLLS